MSSGIITVVGSYVVDLMSRTPHMPKPGETVLGGPFRMGPGGKGGNQAVAAARQGSRVCMVTKVGNDPFGQAAVKHFQAEHISTDYVFVDDAEATGAALIAVDDNGENMIVVALGACGKLSAEDVAQAEQMIKRSTVVLVQLETSMEAVRKTLELAGTYGVPVILNPAPYQPIPEELLKGVTYITPNETEAFLLTGIEITDEESAYRAASVLYRRGVKHVVITLGKKGCYYYEGGPSGILYPGFHVDAVDTTGAGDAFNGGLAHALAEGRSIRQALRYANAVAALSVTKIGTAPAMPSREEVERFLQNQPIDTTATGA
ncbi:ribokinase [Brevibacillus thermoruber]|uniref:Ribokinase n=1 Tax=Brevibacillus thermoruber TaxID=33942 RepID=A0A9X3TP17_9BACL|nr:ribokinase [Brevibacillus thermoruber]MDA5107925.1 ribokinase [Brevibacillus thermoruber]